jgi:hypothetical protein
VPGLPDFIKRIQIARLWTREVLPHASKSADNIFNQTAKMAKQRGVNLTSERVDSIESGADIAVKYLPEGNLKMYHHQPLAAESKRAVGHEAVHVTQHLFSPVNVDESTLAGINLAEMAHGEILWRQDPKRSFQKIYHATPATRKFVQHHWKNEVQAYGLTLRNAKAFGMTAEEIANDQRVCKSYSDALVRYRLSALHPMRLVEKALKVMVKD